ncbi:DUF1360 domain-containing protein [Streptomyces scabiei]|uniref:DUF1360 domain-containing protein n=1 Tax=Streptomyces scabiei TaxID=1930 RepID=UPI0038F69655
METWLLLLVMALSVYRLTKLVVEDTFPPVLWLRDRLVGGWRPLTLAEQERYPEVGDLGTDTPTAHMGLDMVMRIDGEMNRYVRRAKWSPFWLAELVSCPWCASGWVALGVTGGVWAVAGLAMPVLVWLATWAAGALLAAQEWA